MNLRTVNQFVLEHPDAESSLNDWVIKVRAAQWKNNADISKTFNNADHLGGQKFIFNIGGTNFRLAAMVWIKQERVYILKIMTHAQCAKEKF